MRFRHRLWFAAATLVILAGFLYDFDGYPLLEPDEGRNAEVSREMALTNDYVLPRLNGIPYVDKPALYFVAGALGMEILGPTSLAARLPSLVFTLATVLVVAWFARRLFGANAPWIAAAVTAATPFTLAYSRTVIFDSALTLWVVLALVGFYLSVSTSPPTTGRSPPKAQSAPWYRALAWAAMGLGVLTKGPIALGIPLLVAVPYAVWRKRTRALFDPVAVLLFVAIVLPWVVAVSREVPGFLGYAIGTETVARLTTSTLERTGPFWYFLAILPAATLPWSIVLAVGGWQEWRSARGSGRAADERVVFLIVWILVPLVFFTLSQSKRPQYMLPLVPAVGLLVGALWTDMRGRLQGARPAALGLGLLGVFFILTRASIASWVSTSPDVAGAIPWTATLFGSVCCVAAGAAWIGAGQRGAAVLALSLPVASIPVVGADLMGAIGRDRSAEDLAIAIRDAAGDGVEIVGISALPLSLPFYANRTVTLSTADGAELTSNYLVRTIDTWRGVPGSTLRDVDWWRQAVTSCARSRAFVVRAEDAPARSFLDGAMPLIIATRKWAAYGPCGTGRLAATQQPAPNRAERPGDQQAEYQDGQYEPRS